MANTSSSTRSGSSSKGGSRSISLNDTWGGSDSSTYGGSSSDSHTEGGSSSHTEGGSSSHSEGGGQSRTQGGSESRSRSYGENSTIGRGRSWASGQVSDRTQEKYNQATEDYVRSQAVEDAYANLQSAMNNKPAFQSQYEDKLSQMYDRIMNEAGSMTSKFVSEAGVTVTYTISKQDGSDYDSVVAQETAPENPSEGDYWLNTTEGSEGLNVYVQSSWQPVPTCYIRIEIEGAGFDDYFTTEDVINLNSATVQDINNGSLIQAISEDYIVVIGLMDAVTKTETTSAAYKLTIERVLPELDYICADKNRLWGCRYGYDSRGDLINEIYASKLGDFRNWYSYQGLSTDSYAATIGIPGQFTGCISYGGYPTFFKENAIIRVSGSYPAEYNVMQMEARGVQDGSHKSLAIVGEALYYKAPGGVMVYDGSLPQMISAEFGREERT